MNILNVALFLMVFQKEERVIALLNLTSLNTKIIFAYQHRGPKFCLR